MWPGKRRVLMEVRPRIVLQLHILMDSAAQMISRIYWIASAPALHDTKYFVGNKHRVQSVAISLKFSVLCVIP
jgi:hypothetical protein